MKKDKQTDFSIFQRKIAARFFLCAALVMVTGFTLPVLGMFTLPAAGFLGGLVTVIGMIEHITGNNLFTGLPL